MTVAEYNAEFDVVYPGHIVSSEPVVTVAEDAWRAFVALRGELDLADVPRLEQVLSGHLDAGRRVLRLDTQDVTFLDSSVLGVIVAIHRRCAELQATLILTGVSGIVQRVVQLTALDQVLLIDRASA
jgi:anti-sigma B factor antagonist